MVGRGGGVMKRSQVKYKSFQFRILRQIHMNVFLSGRLATRFVTLKVYNDVAAELSMAVLKYVKKTKSPPEEILFRCIKSLVKFRKRISKPEQRPLRLLYKLNFSWTFCFQRCGAELRQFFGRGPWSRNSVSEIVDAAMKCVRPFYVYIRKIYF